MHMYPINGACNRVAADATAFAYRDAKFATVIAGMWPDPADNEKNIKWVKDYYHAVHPNSLAGGMSTLWPATIRIESGTTTRGTTIGWSRSRGNTTRPICST